MKKLFYLIVVIIVCVVACTSEEMVPTERVRTHGESRLIAKSNHVSLDNVMILTGVMRKATRAAVGDENDDFICIVDTDNDTLFYVVNHPEGGWTMYASDKRVPAIVAENEEGRFDLKETEEVMGTWFEAMKEDMKRVQNAEDKDLNFTAEEIEANKAYWDAVCNADEFARSHIETTRGGILDPGLLILPGHYVLYDTWQGTQTYDYIDHLLSTTWDEGTPYNKYYPLADSTTHAISSPSTTAIAAAQMLYFLHYKIDVPENIPDTTFCHGTIFEHPIRWNQWYSGSNIWGKMPNHGNPGYYGYDNGGHYISEGTFAAPLIANMDKLMNNGISVLAGTGFFVDNAANLPANVFAQYGIECRREIYNTDSIFQSLLSEMPVIVEVEGTYRTVQYNATGPAHQSAIIDGYKRVRNTTTYYYVWKYDFPIQNPDGSFIPVPMVPDSMSVVITSSPYINAYRMNWGNGSIDNTWYALTSDWILGFTDIIYTFTNKKHMTYGFKSLE